MSTTLATTNTPEVELPITLVRTFDAELAPGDGRTLDLRIVPYETPTTVADPPHFTPYQEQFMPGAFERQMANPDRVRVWLNFEHEDGLRGIVGHGLNLLDRDAALHGSFRVHENPDGEKALQLVHERVLTGVSLEFKALRSRTVGGVVQRLRAHIDKVSLCRTPAYEDARVLAVRVAPVEAVAVAVAPAPENEELLERLSALGVEPLRRIATTSKAWDGSPARFTDEQYQRSAVLDRGGDAPIKQRFGLPVLEPDGTLNTNALGPAAGALAGGRGGVTGATAAQKATAARKLVRYYGQANMEPPASLTALARS